MNCKKCGNPVKDSAKFCRSCGAPAGSFSPEPANTMDSKKCPSCGASVGPSVSFCPICGQAMDSPKPSSESSSTMTCKYCGSPHKEGKRFCSSCGKPISAGQLETQRASSNHAQDESPPVSPGHSTNSNKPAMSSANMHSEADSTSTKASKPTLGVPNPSGHSGDHPSKRIGASASRLAEASIDNCEPENVVAPKQEPQPTPSKASSPDSQKLPLPRSGDRSSLQGGKAILREKNRSSSHGSSRRGLLFLVSSLIILFFMGVAVIGFLLYSHFLRPSTTSPISLPPAQTTSSQKESSPSTQEISPTPSENVGHPFESGAPNGRSAANQGAAQVSAATPKNASNESGGNNVASVEASSSEAAPKKERKARVASHPKFVDVTELDSTPIPSGKPKILFTDEATNAQLRGTVVLELSIDSTGRVTDSKVVQGPTPDYGMDKVCQDAATKLVYSVPRRKGVAETTRILLPIVLTPPPLPKPPVERRLTSLGVIVEAKANIGRFQFLVDGKDMWDSSLVGPLGETKRQTKELKFPPGKHRIQLLAWMPRATKPFESSGTYTGIQGQHHVLKYYITIFGHIKVEQLQ